MADSLLDNYNPLYDIHLRQYFASPHMQKHLQKMGLLESTLNLNGDEVYARHHAMMDMMLKNREAQLMKMADLRKKLDAAEKVEICRRIRSGQSPESYRRGKPSRSLSRNRAAQRGIGRQRRFSNSFEDKDFVQHIEAENMDHSEYDTKDPYKRLSANAKRFNYLHKLDDPTLIAYKDNLKRQLQRLERFREISFGPHSVARQPPPPQASWFFRRRSLPSLTASAPGNTLKDPLRSVLNMRGRKDARHVGAKLNVSHDNRTSCPPTTRKRRDSNPRLPPINGTKIRMNKVSGLPASSGFSTKLPPTGKKQSPSRGRPVTKRLTATTTTTEIKTKNSSKPPTGGRSPSPTKLPSVTGHAILGGAAVAATVGATAVAVKEVVDSQLSSTLPSVEQIQQTPTPPSSPVLSKNEADEEATIESIKAASPDVGHTNDAFSDRSERSVESVKDHHEELSGNEEEIQIQKNVSSQEVLPSPTENTDNQNQNEHYSESESEPEYAEEDQYEIDENEKNRQQESLKQPLENESNLEENEEFTENPREIPEFKVDYFPDKEPEQTLPVENEEHTIAKRDTESFEQIHEQNVSLPKVDDVSDSEKDDESAINIEVHFSPKTETDHEVHFENNLTSIVTKVEEQFSQNESDIQNTIVDDSTENVDEIKNDEEEQNDEEQIDTKGSSEVVNNNTEQPEEILINKTDDYLQNENKQTEAHDESHDPIEIAEINDNADNSILPADNETESTIEQKIVQQELTSSPNTETFVHQEIASSPTSEKLDERCSPLPEVVVEKNEADLIGNQTIAQSPDQVLNDELIVEEKNQLFEENDEEENNHEHFSNHENTTNEAQSEDESDQIEPAKTEAPELLNDENPEIFPPKDQVISKTDDDTHSKIEESQQFQEANPEDFELEYKVSEDVNDAMMTSIYQPNEEETHFETDQELSQHENKTDSDLDKIENATKLEINHEEQIENHPQDAHLIDGISIQDEVQEKSTEQTVTHQNEVSFDSKLESHHEDLSHHLTSEPEDEFHQNVVVPENEDIIHSQHETLFTHQNEVSFDSKLESHHEDLPHHLTSEPEDEFHQNVVVPENEDIIHSQPETLLESSHEDDNKNVDQFDNHQAEILVSSESIDQQNQQDDDQESDKRPISVESQHSVIIHDNVSSPISQPSSPVLKAEEHKEELDHLTSVEQSLVKNDAEDDEETNVSTNQEDEEIKEVNTEAHEIRSPISENDIDNVSTDSLIIHDDNSDYQLSKPIFESNEKIIDNISHQFNPIVDKESSNVKEDTDQTFFDKNTTNENGTLHQEPIETVTSKIEEKDDIQNNNDDDHDDDKMSQKSFEPSNENGNVIRESIATSGAHTVITTTGGLPTSGFLVDEEEEEKNISSI